MINLKLAKARGLSEETILEIQIYQDIADDIKTTAKKASEKLLPKHYEDWFEVQKHLQSLWGFEQNETYIKFWEFPRCTCPKIDNEDRYPLGWYTTNTECPVHGLGE